MILVQALQIAHEVTRIKKLAGMNAIYPYKQEQFADAVECLQGHLTATKAEVDALRAQIQQLNLQIRKRDKSV